jgi:RNA polymerase sigma factor (sigma-70 family)
MAKTQLGSVLRHLRQAAGTGQSHALGDGDLLGRFIDGRDEAAFTALVRRHAGLVFGVCRQVLGQEQDAEDAFQATFLALAQGAASVRKLGSVASWLHGAAYRMSLRAKRDAARRRSHERRAGGGEASRPSADLSWREVQAALHEEIQRLPDKYRAPVVLCCLEGKHCKEAARALGLKEGTVWSRLAQARKTLHGRLGRRGLDLGALLTGVGVAGQVAPAMPPLLVSTTARAAVQIASRGPVAGAASANALALVTGVTETMVLSKLKFAGAVLLVMAAVAAGAGLLANSPSAAHHGPAATIPVGTEASPLPATADEPAARDREKIRTDPTPASDPDGLSDFHKLHKYRIDPDQKGPAGQGVAGGDWQQRPRVHLQRPRRPPRHAALQPQGDPR